MERYKLKKIVRQKSKKTGNDYYIAFVIFESETNCDIIQVIITKEVAEILSDSLVDDNTLVDITSNFGFKYNTYQRRSEPYINI